MSNNRKIQFPSLETKRQNLRILTLQDADEVFKHFSDENITKFMDIDPCKNIQEAEEIIGFHIEDSGCRWGIYDKLNDGFIGTCGFHYLRRTDNNFVAEIGFDLSTSYWGKGFMSEALNEIIEFGFTKMGLTMIDATVEPENERSIKLMNNLGFERAQELKDDLVYFYLNRDLFIKNLVV